MFTIRKIYSWCFFTSANRFSTFGVMCYSTDRGYAISASEISK